MELCVEWKKYVYRARKMDNGTTNNNNFGLKNLQFIVIPLLVVNILSSHLITSQISKCWKKNESKKFFWRLKLAINSLPFVYIYICILHTTGTSRKSEIISRKIMKPRKSTETISLVGHQIKCNWIEGDWRTLLIKYDDVIALEINIFIE